MMNLNSNTGGVGVYYDFENLHATCYEAIHGPGSYKKHFHVHDALLNLDAITQAAALHGNILISRAYGNFQWLCRYRDQLVGNGIDMVQLYPTVGSKNAADIRLCLDAQKDALYNANLSTVIIVSGDSDFMPLAQALKAAGKRVIGIGCKASSSKYWIKSCHEFLFYEDLAPPLPAQEIATPFLETGIQAISSVSSPGIGIGAKSPDAVEQLLRKAVARLMRERDCDWVLKATIRPMMVKLDPDFTPQNHGTDSFSEFMAKYADTVLDVRNGVHGQEYRVKTPVATATATLKNETAPEPEPVTPMAANKSDCLAGKSALYDFLMELKALEL